MNEEDDAIIVVNGQRRLAPSVASEWRKRQDEAKPTSYNPSSRRSGAGYRLSVEEKKRIHTQTGQHFEDYAQYRAWCRASGYRDVERGEPQDVYRRDMAEWVDSGAQGEPPHEWTGAARRRPEGPMPWHQE